MIALLFKEKNYIRSNSGISENLADNKKVNRVVSKSPINNYHNSNYNYKTDRDNSENSHMEYNNIYELKDLQIESPKTPNLEQRTHKTTQNLNTSLDMEGKISLNRGENNNNNNHNNYINSPQFEWNNLEEDIILKNKLNMNNKNSLKQDSTSYYFNFSRSY